MLGLMQDRPLLISQMIEFAAAYYPKVEIVTRSVEGPIHRYGYRDAALRAGDHGQQQDKKRHRDDFECAEHKVSPLNSRASGRHSVPRRMTDVLTRGWTE